MSKVQYNICFEIETILDFGEFVGMHFGHFGSKRKTNFLEA